MKTNTFILASLFSNKAVVSVVGAGGASLLALFLCSCASSLDRAAANLESAFYARPARPVIQSRTGDWKDSQIYDPTILTNPSDPAQLILWTSGMYAPVASGEQCIGRFTASTKNPESWAEDAANPVFRKSSNGWDNGSYGVRLGSIVYHEGKYYLYYTGTTADGHFKLGLATSADGIKFTRTGSGSSAGLILDASGDEVHVNDPAVIRVGATWYMYYGYRTASQTLPGIRVATSSDGIKWTKHAGNVLSKGAPGSYDDHYIEWHQVFKLGASYMMVYECYDGTTYSLSLAHSADPLGPFIKSACNPILRRSNVPGAFDRYHVATGALYNLNGSWYLFYCGAMDPAENYCFSHWDLAIAKVVTGRKGGKRTP